MSYPGVLWDLPCWLRWTEVYTDNLGGGVLVAEFNGPDTGAGADVEHAAGLVADGRKVEFLAEADLEHLVHEV